MLFKNDEREGTVVAVGADGEGIVKDEGYTAFVPFALTGEKIRYRVLKVKDKIVYGKVIEVITPAEERVRPACPVFGRCGGCRLQHVKYSAQLKIKENNVKNCFLKVAGLDVKVLSAVCGENEYRYRNNLQLPVAEQNGETVVGFYAENSHRVVPINDCFINAEWTADVINSLKTYMSELGLKGYDETAREGDIREITVKDVKGSLIITIVSLKRNLKSPEEFVKILKKKIKSPFSLYVNFNPTDTNVIYGEEFRLICGEPDYEAELFGIKYRVGVRSFMQVNNSVCSKLYSSVLNSLGDMRDSTVIDAYSGAGLLTALIASNAEKAIGIEIIEEAVKLADEIKINNNLQNRMENILGKCEDVLPQIVEREKNKGKKISVVLDPPRKGCDIKVINALIASDAEKIVYVSCKPSTLARDVGLLVGSLVCEDGVIKRAKEYEPRYEIVQVRPFDMFAETKHVETLVVLSHKKPDTTINVKIEFGEREGEISLKNIAARAESYKPKEKVTYKMIQDYIEATYGFKVHTAYIAEVKRDLGLPMYDAPNAVEELKKPRQHPSEKMVKAIKETLKHFEII